MAHNTAALVSRSLTNDDLTFLHIRLTVENTLNKTALEYKTSVIEGGVLMEALTRLQDEKIGFTFTVKVDPYSGLFLESVNGVAGNEQDHTFWLILTESSGQEIPVPQELGCYRPHANEHIILQFDKWTEQKSFESHGEKK